MGGFLLDIPGAAFIKARTMITGKRPTLPWWPTRVIPVVDAHLNSESDVVEFGSGSSTIWLARRSRSVYSMEDNPKWAQITTDRLSECGLSNATVTFAEGEAFSSIPEDKGPFDLAVVDGSYRWKCVETVLPRMKSGGIIYLDNADADKDRQLYPDKSMVREAQALMEAYAKENPKARLVKLRSLAHGELAATEGWLLYMP